MKKIFSILAAALMGVSAMAATTFTFSGSTDPQSKDGFTVTLDKGKGASAPGLSQTGVVRVYTGNTITVEGSGITRLDIKFAKGKNEKDYATATADGGNYVSGGNATSDTDYKVDVWTGSANKVVITMGGTATQRSIHQLVVNGDGTIPTPTPGGDDEEEGGEQGGGTTPTGSIAITNDFLYADAYNFDDEDGKGWIFDFYSDYDEETYEVLGEELSFYVLSNKTTSINGTYKIEEGYYYKDDADEDGVDFTSGSVTIAATGKSDDYGDPIYQFTATFQGVDGKTYTFKKAIGVYAYNDDDDIVLNEGGSNGGGTTGGDPVPAGAITVAKALEIGGKLADKAETAETYTVVGYVGKLDKPYDAEKKDQCWFMCDDKAEVGSDAYFNFEAYWCYISEAVKLGDYVSVTGKIKKYGKTIEIMNGQAKKLSAPQGIENAENEVVLKKTIEDGQLIIRRGEKLYNVMGQSL